MIILNVMLTFNPKIEFSIPIIKYLRANIKMNSLNYEKTEWYATTDLNIIYNKYFNKNKFVLNKIFDKEQKGFIYCIHNIPAAITISRNNLIEEFQISKDFIILFDGGNEMRKKFYMKYKSYKIDKAKNLDDFNNF